MFNLKYLFVYGALAISLCGVNYWINKKSEEGYGYSGYRGFARTHSSWYRRDYDHGIIMASNRENSVTGNRFSQRGLSGGK